RTLPPLHTFQVAPIGASLAASLAPLIVPIRGCDRTQAFLWIVSAPRIDLPHGRPAARIVWNVQVGCGLRVWRTRLGIHLTATLVVCRMRVNYGHNIFRRRTIPVLPMRLMVIRPLLALYCARSPSDPG